MTPLPHQLAPPSDPPPDEPRRCKRVSLDPYEPTRCIRTIPEDAPLKVTMCEECDPESYEETL